LFHPNLNPRWDRVPLHAGDAVNNGKMGFHGGIDVNDGTVNSLHVENVFRPPVKHAGHNTEHVFHGKGHPGPFNSRIPESITDAMSASYPGTGAMNVSERDPNMEHPNWKRPPNASAAVPARELIRKVRRVHGG
jgi:hypothetical protein